MGTSPTARKWASAHAASDRPTSRPPFDIWSGNIPPAKRAGSTCGKNMAPWAARYLAGALFDHDSGYLPCAWDRAAQFSVARARPLPDCFFGAVHAGNSAVSPPLPQEEMDRDPKPKVNLSTGAPRLPGEILRRRRRPPTRRSTLGSTATPVQPGSLFSVSQPRGGYGDADPYTMSENRRPHLIPVKLHRANA